jgi:hypothetical protein
MKIILPLAALLALPLTACGSKDAATAEPNAAGNEAMAAAPPAELPPMITASKPFRCKDGSVLYVTFYSDETTVSIRQTETQSVGTKLVAPAAGETYVGEGYSLKGNTAEAEIAVPGKPAQSCKA